VGGGTLSLARPTPVDENSLFRIYSMSKPITGMATMILIDEGKLGLDQPLHEILPAFRDMRVLVDPAGPLENTVPAERPITIRQLLTHTAGLGYQIISKGPLLAAYNTNGLVGGRVSKMPIPGFPAVTPAPGLEAWADRLAGLPQARTRYVSAKLFLRHEPGDRPQGLRCLELRRLGELSVADATEHDQAPGFLGDPRHDRSRAVGRSTVVAGIPQTHERVGADQERCAGEQREFLNERRR
jgi:hypothetical protein